MSVLPCEFLLLLKTTKWSNADFENVAGGSPTIPTTRTIYRASVLDVTDPSSFHAQFSTFDTANTSFYSDTGVFNFTTSNFTLASTSDTDGLSEMRVTADYNDVQYDLTFEFSLSSQRRHR